MCVLYTDGGKLSYDKIPIGVNYYIALYLDPTKCCVTLQHCNVPARGYCKIQ